MPDERLPESTETDDLARALMAQLESGGTLDLAVKAALLDLLAKQSQERIVLGEVEEARAEIGEAAEVVADKKIGLDAMSPNNENEATVLRAVRAMKMWLNHPVNERFTDEETAESEWFRREFDRRSPELNRAMADLLKRYASTMEIDDAGYFLNVLFKGEMEEVSFSGTSPVPKGFSEGTLLEARRQLITRYLSELSGGDPYNTPRLWYLFLIRPEVYAYLKGEDVRQIVSEMIQGHASQEEAQPQRVAYIRGVLRDTLENLDREQSVVDELNALSRQYPSPEYSIRFSHTGHPKEAGNIVVVDRKKAVVETVHPTLPMIAAEFGFRRPPTA